MASEVHEGHSILMAELYTRRIHENMTASEIAMMLSCFLEYTADEIIQETKIGTKIRQVAKEMHIDCKITDYWVDIVRDWMGGAECVCEKYGVEHGNFVRAMLKLANMVREWECMATFVEDVEMRDMMRNAEQIIVRDFVVPTSLYIKM